MTDKRTLLYEGKAKNLYQTDDEAVVLAAYKDQATALNGKKKDQIAGKGELNNQITSLIFRELNRRGVHTHFIEQVSTTEQLNTKVDIIPLEVVVRNYTAGSFSKRFGIEEGIKIPTPIVEFYYKNDDITVRSTIKIIEHSNREYNFEVLTHSYAHVHPGLVRMEFGDGKQLGEYKTQEEAKFAAQMHFNHHHHIKYHH